MSSFADSLVIPVSFFALCVTLVFIFFIYDSLSASDSTIIGVTAPQVKQTFGVLVALIPLILMGFGLGAIVSAFLIRTHPIFFGISILLLLIQMLVTPILTNVWSSIMTSTPDLQAKAASLTFIVLIMDKLPLISFILACLVAVVSYLRGVG